MKPSIELLQQKFTGIFEFELLQELSQAGNYTTIEEGHVLMNVGGYIRSVPIILTGSIKILRHDNEGREALLYYLGGLDSCAMSYLLFRTQAKRNTGSSRRKNNTYQCAHRKSRRMDDQI